VMADEIARLDALDGWPSPEAQPRWYGATAAETTLLDAYRGGRMHHAWLLGGAKGIGKATLAYRFARFVLAHADPKALEVRRATDLGLDPEHLALRKVAARAHPNLLVLQRAYNDERKRFYTELTVDEIRRTISFFGSTSGEDGWRISIVDPADDMNASAANALLKILEEPPSQSLFLIVSHAPGRLVPTIRSRCRRLNLRPLSQDAIATALRDNAGEFDEEEVATASALAEGSLRKAIHLTTEDGLSVYRGLSGLLAGLPELDIEALHGFADRVAGRGNDEAYAGFLDTLSAWFDRRVRNESEPDPAARLAPAVRAAPLETWPELWENLRHSSALADELNLDRKQAVLSILMNLARATRM
jgi:DNA polymerase-3 subunit delta'